MFFFIYWKFHHPNWLHIFQRGRYTTNQIFGTLFIFHFIYEMSSFPVTNSYFSRWLLHHQPDNHQNTGIVSALTAHFSDLFLIFIVADRQPSRSWARCLSCTRVTLRAMERCWGLVKPKCYEIQQENILLSFFFLQCGPHPQWCERWFISPSNYSYCCTINHSYWSYVHQPSYRLGASHCKWQHVFRWRMCMMIVYVHSEELGFDVTSFTSVMFSSHVGPIMGMASFGWYRDAGVATMIAIPKHG